MPRNSDAFRSTQYWELIMDAKPISGFRSSIRSALAAALAAFIAIGILSAIVSLFQSRGVPLERLAAAERACASHDYQSEREACMKQWLAESAHTNVVQK
jgi:hypothetical protein